MEQNVEVNVENKDEKTLNAFMVCTKLGVSVQTLSNWYRYQKSGNNDTGLPLLPAYFQENIHSIRLWSLNDVDQLLEFKRCLGRGRGGKMGSWNARYWQNRGKRALDNKESKKKEEK